MIISLRKWQWLTALIGESAVDVDRTMVKVSIDNVDATRRVYWYNGDDDDDSNSIDYLRSNRHTIFSRIYAKLGAD